MAKMTKKKKSSLPPLSDISVEDLRREDAIWFLGTMAAKGLEAFGQVNMVISGSGKVSIANPVHVYFDTSAWIDEDIDSLPPFKWVRPILGQGKPQYVAWRDGELWEIEFEEELQKPASG